MSARPQESAHEIAGRVARWLWSDRFFLTIAGVLAVLNLGFLLASCVNVPQWDEWDLLAPGALDRSLNLGWLFEVHNEHRIVLTKLETWLLYRFARWNQQVMITCNFAFYLSLWWALWRFAKEQLESSLDFVPALALSTLAAENLYWGFQSQFHFFLLLFVVALWLGARGPRWGWLGALAAVGCAYSFSSGVICAFSTAAFYLFLAWTRRPNGKQHLAQAILIAAASALWFIDYHRKLGVPEFTPPWTRGFWTYYLNLVGYGFGFDDESIVPGIVVLVVLTVVCGLQTRDATRNKAGREAWIALMVLAAGILLSLAAVSLARAGFGVSTAKTSRYGEIAFVLVPVVWLLVKSQLRKAQARWRTTLLAALGLCVIVPFLDNYQFRGVYYVGEMRRNKLEGRKCIQRYLIGQGDCYCPTSFPYGSIAPRVQRAKELKVSFVDEMLQ